MNVMIDGGIVIRLEDRKKINIWGYVYDTRNKDRVQTFYPFTENGKSYLRFPRNWGKFKRNCLIDGEEFKIYDRRVEVPLSNYELSKTFSLRDYQKPVVKKLQQVLKSEPNSAILQAEPSFGKSYILPKIVEAVGQKTLILVDRNLLAKQMMEEFSKNTKNGAVFLTKDMEEFPDVTISTFQIITKHPKLLDRMKKQFGLVVVDEAHVAPAATYSWIISKINAKYRLGLSATPSRSDGLTEVIVDTFGSRIVKGSNPNNLKTFNIVVDTKIPIKMSPKSNFSKAFSDGVLSVDNTLGITYIELAAFAANAMVRKGRRVFIYLGYSKLQKLMQVSLEKKGISSEIIDGKTPHSRREEILQKFENGDVDVLISGVILQKGISIPAMDCIINISSQNKENMEQVIGRLRREKEGKKQPIFIYFSLGGLMENSDRFRIDTLKTISQKSGDKFTIMSKNSFMKKMVELIGGDF